MSSSKIDTRSSILTIARRLLRDGGSPAVTFDAIARELGFSKQAVIYWFPNKEYLIAELFLPFLEAEAEAAIGAVAGITDPNKAIAAFIRSIAEFHLGDLERFRIMYLVPQIGNKPGSNAGQMKISQRVHPVSDRLYGALATILEAELQPVQARRNAVVIHTCVLGLTLLHSLGNALNDPLKHSAEALTTSLIELLCRPRSANQGAVEP